MASAYNKDIYPYIVVGDGMVNDSVITKSLLMTGKTNNPVPVFLYAQTLEKARELAQRMSEWNSTVWICKVEEVIE